VRITSKLARHDDGYGGRAKHRRAHLRDSICGEGIGKIDGTKSVGNARDERIAKETGGVHMDAVQIDPHTYFRQIAEELRTSHEPWYYLVMPGRMLPAMSCRPSEPDLWCVQKPDTSRVKTRSRIPRYVRDAPVALGAAETAFTKTTIV
jgi:hypothetical protein